MKGRLKTYIVFSDDLCVFIIFVGRVHATALVSPINFVAWASPTSHSRFQTTCPPIISVGRTHATDTVPAKTGRHFKHKRSSENLHRVFRRPLCVHHFRGQSPRYGTCVAKKLCSVGFAHEPLKISDDLYVYRFRGQSPRYGTCVAKKLCSVGYAHEPLKISDDLSASQLRG